MTAPQNPPPGASKDAASARKRRRRAPAGGAADDCFTCAKRNVKCDRKRPYCSQCLEIGNDCSGYKTQLTWGVGVASRGKLRGLSLPIAKAPPVNPVKKSPTRSPAGPNVGSGQWTEQDEQACKEDIEMHSEAAPSVPPTPLFNPYEMSHISSPEHTPAVPQSPWSNMQFPSSLPESEGPRFQDGNLHLSVPVSSMLSSSMDSISEVDYMSPLAQSFPRDDIPFLHSPTAMYEHFQPQSPPVTQSPTSAMMIEQPRPPTSCPSLVYGPSEQSSSLHSHMDNYDAQISHKLMQDCESLSGTPELDAYSTSAQSQPFWAPSVPEEEAIPHSLPDPSPPNWPSRFASQILPVSAELIAKMPFFMDYYENTMCPSMVFIDGPHNPFREHILQLAASSRSLQHAICALAACNLRMKRKLSLGQHGRDIGEKRLDMDSMSETQPEDQSLSEEYQHRNLAVHLLNEQLNDTDKSSHDSVLATILMLCHYRMAESGVAKFHTQFAGVKKILGLRRMSPFPPSRDSAWMEALFTYFDAISASINDREAQLTTSFYGVLPDAQLLPPGSENLVGCDRELFKTIIKLGRLNLLSQHRPVQNLLGSGLSRGMPSRSESPLHTPLGHTYRPNRTPHPHQMSAEPLYFSSHNNRYDGNGYSTSLNDEDILSPGVLHSPNAYDDHRSTFWREWKDARIALQSWEFDSQRVVNGLLPASSSVSSAVLSPGAGIHSPTGSGGMGHHGQPSGGGGGGGGGPPAMAVTPSQVRDLGSLSEAFRYAALLYTERLASPNVPSAHSNFRNLVSQVVYYATSLEAGSNAEKFLLWPLFVAGSECVNELQQNIVRSKCREIMARSGYMNNLAALDVLERLWGGDWKDESRSMGMMKRGPFNWTKCIGGPGVEVEWIMF